MKSEPDIPSKKTDALTRNGFRASALNPLLVASEVGFGITILQPLLLTYQALSVPTLIYFQTQLQMVFILVLLQLIMKLISQYREVGLKTERKKKAQRAPETDEAQDGSASTGIVARPTVHSVFTSFAGEFRALSLSEAQGDHVPSVDT